MGLESFGFSPLLPGFKLVAIFVCVDADDNDDDDSAIGGLLCLKPNPSKTHATAFHLHKATRTTQNFMEKPM